MDLPARLRAFIAEQELWPEGAALVLGVSGGPDSLCLLEALTALAGPARWRLYVACLDHGLRPEAAGEARQVGREAQRRGWPFFTERVDTRAYAAAGRLSLEEAARSVRYAFLARAARQAGAACVVVAHTADDQAETVLMHLLRGSGLAGLRGMRPLAPLPGAPDLALARPLLTTTRAEVEAYCAARSLAPALDPTNHDLTPFRNRLRHGLLPELEKYNPAIRAVLRRTAEAAAGDYAIVQAVTAEAWAQVARAEAGAVVFDRAGWLRLTRPVQRALLREAVARLRPDLRDAGFAPIEQAVRFSRRAAPGRACDVAGGLRLAVTAEALRLGAAKTPDLAAQPQLDAAGRLAGGWQFLVRDAMTTAATLAEAAANTDPWTALVDAEQLPAGEWRLRARRPGDRFQPLGLAGHSCTLADFFINAKVPAAARAAWPLVVRGEQIVWVAGLRLDERFKVTAATRRVVRLRFTPPQSG